MRNQYSFIRNIGASALLFSALFGPGSNAQEGLWQPEQLSSDGQLLQQLGLTAAEQAGGLALANITPALVRIGHCSGAFIAASGLLVTSASCVNTVLPEAVKAGFSSTSSDTELPLGTLQLHVLQQTTDVTVQVRRQLGLAADVQSQDSDFTTLKQKMIADCQRKPHYHCELNSLHSGLQYQLVQYKTLRDVRLVYLPSSSESATPASWPRYDANYVLLRAYVSADGAVAGYHNANKPYRTAFLPVTAQGVTENELLLTAGFASLSHRYSNSAEVRFQFEQWAPLSLAYTEQMIQLLQRLSTGEGERAQRYGSTLQQLQRQAARQQAKLNQYPYSDILASRALREQAMQQWIDASPVRQQLYRPVLENFNRLVLQHQQMQLRDLVLQYLQYARLPALARQLYHSARLPDHDRTALLPRLVQQILQFDDSFDARIDMELALHFLWQYSQQPARLRLPALDQYFALSDGFNREIVRHKLSAIYRGTSLRDAGQRQLWLNRSAKQFEHSSDPLLNFTVAMYDSLQQLTLQRRAMQDELVAARAAVMEVLIAYNDALGRATYAEANGSLRYSLGRVSGYQPTDAVWHQPFSSLHSLLRRQGADTAPAVGAPAKWIPVNFLTSTDSGSDCSGAVTVNTRGELVGIMFAGVRENLLADWHYDANQSRTVHVDSRFILWQLQQSANSRALIDEITPRR